MGDSNQSCWTVLQATSRAPWYLPQISRLYLSVPLNRCSCTQGRSPPLFKLYRPQLSGAISNASGYTHAVTRRSMKCSTQQDHTRVTLSVKHSTSSVLRRTEIQPSWIGQHRHAICIPGLSAILHVTQRSPLIPFRTVRLIYKPEEHAVTQVRSLPQSWARLSMLLSLCRTFCVSVKTRPRPCSQGRASERLHTITDAWRLPPRLAKPRPTFSSALRCHVPRAMLQSWGHDLSVPHRYTSYADQVCNLAAAKCLHQLLIERFWRSPPSQAWTGSTLSMLRVAHLVTAAVLIQRSSQSRATTDAGPATTPLSVYIVSISDICLQQSAAYPTSICPDFATWQVLTRTSGSLNPFDDTRQGCSNQATQQQGLLVVVTGQALHTWPVHVSISTLVARDVASHQLYARHRHRAAAEGLSLPAYPGPATIDARQSLSAPWNRPQHYGLAYVPHLTRKL